MRNTLLLLLFMTAIAGRAKAHPPENISIHFDRAKSILTVTVEHKSNKPFEHFINEIEVRVNKKKRLVHSITFQENEKSQRASYLFTDVGPGDEIQIIAKCNVFGRGEAVYEVKDE